MQAYSDPKRESLPTALPDIEVFHVGPKSIASGHARIPVSGWYWWPCFPGCLPDGDPTGPFDSEAEALADAQSDAADDDDDDDDEDAADPDDPDVLDPLICSVCNGPLNLLGSLGLTVWYRCRNCGLDQSVPVARAV